MKYKKLTKEQILISIDRLTRFKNTKEKYLRVYTDIILSNLIDPKLKKSDIEKMDYLDITMLATEIFNNSFESPINDNYINKELAKYENSIFINDKETQKLLENGIDYTSALKYINKNSPSNLYWLSIIYKEKDANKEYLRTKYHLKYPVKEVLLVEGITEEILLPVFGKYLKCDFYDKGIQIIAAGGKNQVVKMYYKLADELKLPIFILLDKDAEENIKQIKPKLRSIDKIHLVSCGEFEDLLPKSLIVKTVNSHFNNFLKITENDLNTDISMVKVLEELFKTRGLHEFKKAEFAKLVKDKISTPSDISPEINTIIKELSNTNKLLDS